jgi:hypothetical protein
VYSHRGVSYDGKWEEGIREGKFVWTIGGASKLSSTSCKALAEQDKIHSFIIIPEVPILFCE